jgi:hypothetical protein
MFVLNGRQQSTLQNAFSGSGGGNGLLDRKPGKVTAFGQKAAESLSVTANVVAGPTMGGSVGNIVTGINFDTILQEILPPGVDDTKFLPQVQAAYTDIYQYDNVAGAAVDAYAQIPFSGYSLDGLPDKQLEPFRRTCERLNIEELMPSLVVDYMVQGAFIGPMLYNPADRIFADIYIVRPEECDFTVLPFFKQDPIIEFRIPERLKKFIASKHPRAIASIERLGEKLGSKFKKGKFELDPMSTLWVPRQTSGTRIATSAYRRLLPMYLVEKSLWRGTLIESSRRQRSVMHLMIGDQEWEPTDADIDAISGYFQAADADPLGAIVATRNGVQVNEVRNPTDFWNVFNLWSDIVPAKLRALGISESFLSGDATLNNLEVSVTNFMDGVRTLRQNLTNAVFNNRIFPAVALANGFWKKGVEKPVELRETGKRVNREKVMRAIQDTSGLQIPTLRWTKTLEPKVNEQMAQMLSQMEEKGIPVPVRLWAAVGGLDLDSLIDKELKKDIEDRGKLAKLKKQIDSQNNSGADGIDLFGGGGQTDDEQQGGFEESAFSRPTKVIGMAKRNYGDLGEIRQPSKSGSRWVPVPNQRKAQAKANNSIIKAIKNVSERNPKPRKRK